MPYKLSPLFNTQCFEHRILCATIEDQIKTSYQFGWHRSKISGACNRQQDFLCSAVKTYLQAVCNRSPLFDAVWSGNNEALTKEMTKLLRMTISYHDYREDFYHAFLAGIFTGAGYVVESNKEHGEGRSDVIVKDIRNGRVAIFEAKYAKTLDALPDACDTAIQQINDRMYAADFRDDYDDILCYGIAFFKKRCMVRKK